LLFRLSYPLPYEDEIRSVEGPDARWALTVVYSPDQDRYP
jgi:hypothetical protein